MVPSLRLLICKMGIIWHPHSGVYGQDLGPLPAGGKGLVNGAGGAISTQRGMGPT